jgi:FkbM family methyltransferase
MLAWAVINWMKPFAHYHQKFRERGIGQLIAGRFRWYWLELRLNNWLIGRLVELTGNRIRLDGVTLSVDNPLIGTPDKSTLFFGIYEVDERELTKRFIDRNLPTVEIGGSIGGVACTTNKLLTNPSAHVVVECNPIVLPTLENNRKLNGCSFEIEPRALAYGVETISFGVPDHFMMGRLHSDDQRQVTVPTTTLRQIVEEHRFETINLISDSEGGEVEMVENDGDILRDRVKWIIMETHEVERGQTAIAQMLNRLHDLGFDIAHKDDDKPVLALMNRRLARQL